MPGLAFETQFPSIPYAGEILHALMTQDEFSSSELMMILDQYLLCSINDSTAHVQSWRTHKEVIDMLLEEDILQVYEDIYAVNMDYLFVLEGGEFPQFTHNE